MQKCGAKVVFFYDVCNYSLLFLQDYRFFIAIVSVSLIYFIKFAWYFH